MRIGLISDTHLTSAAIPSAVVAAFDGVDLILHAGDLVTTEVLRALEAIAPVTAVHGNMDMPSVRASLPSRIAVRCDRHRIGLMHGHLVPHPNRVLQPAIDFQALHNYLLGEFEGDGVDAIVYGHTHQAHTATHGQVLLINPGSATRGSGGRRTVGLLTADAGPIVGQIIELAH